MKKEIISNKVCHFTTVHPAFDIRIFLHECKSLAASGYDVYLIAPEQLDYNDKDITLIPLPTSKNRLYRFLISMPRTFILALRNNAQIYHFHDPELLLVGLLLKLVRKTVIYDAHEHFPFTFHHREWIPSLLRPAIAKLSDIFEIFVAKKLDFIVAATPYIRDRFINSGCRSVDINNFPMLDELWMPHLDWSEKDNAICYVGGLHKIRGIFEMINAIEKIDVKLILAGEFSSSVVRKEILSMDGWEKAESLGFLDRDGVRQVMSRSMAGLAVLQPYPNIVKGQPTKLFEYMAAGIPVIVSDFPFFKKIVERNKCGICVDPQNPDAIAKAIMWMVSHPEEAELMGKNGRRAVETKYSWEIESKKLIKLYREQLR